MRDWLARWFGGRKVHEDDEPARYAQPSPRAIRSVKGSSKIGTPKRGIHADRVTDKAAGKVKSGFDPYNSGSFERSNAWERVIRR